MGLKKLDKLKVITHLAALAPLVYLFVNAFQNQLGADPIREIMRRTGRDALVLLVITLAVGPVRNIFGLARVGRLRRTIGLYTFLYVSVHFLTFAGLDFRFNLSLIKEGVLEKPFALVGFSAFLLLIPLAITSTNGWVRRLGKNWKRLHRVIYLVAALDILHFLWQAKAKALWREPLMYGALIVFLILLRLPAVKKRVSKIGSLGTGPNED